MIDIVFKLNNVDYSQLLSKYTVTIETEYEDVIKTLDGTEYGVPKYRPTIVFSLMPLTEAQSAALFNILKLGSITVTYTDTASNATQTATMRVVSNIESAFGLKSITGNRYYKGNAITLRQRTVL